MKNLSKVMKSVLLTKGITAKHNRKQNVAVSYEMPDEEIRVLIGNLLLEETLETLSALGLTLQWVENTTDPKTKYDITAVVPTARQEDYKPDLMKAIDGVCDTIYVATGILAACGVPDKPHLKEVCVANERKFPKGEVTFDGKTGKYLKPKDWIGPDHSDIMGRMRSIDMKKATDKLVKKFKKKDKK